MKNNNNSLAIAKVSISTMSRNELRAFAKSQNIKRGKNNSDTVANILAAIESGSVQFKSTFCLAPNTGAIQMNQPVAAHTVFQKKFRNYSTNDKVEFSTLAAS